MKDLLSLILAVCLISGYCFFAGKYVLLYSKRKDAGFEANHEKDLDNLDFIRGYS